MVHQHVGDEMDGDVRLRQQFVDSREYLLCDRCGIFNKLLGENEIYDRLKAAIPADCTYCNGGGAVRIYSGLCTRTKMQDAQQVEAISPQPH